MSFPPSVPVPPSGPAVGPASGLAPVPSPAAAPDPSLVWVVPCAGQATSIGAPPVLWMVLTPTQLRDIWARLRTPARPTSRRPSPVVVEAIRGRFGHRPPGVLRALSTTAPIPVAQWQHALHVGVQGGECEAGVVYCQVTTTPRDGRWFVYPKDRAIEPLRAMHRVDLLTPRLSAVSSAAEAGQVLADVVELLAASGGFRVVEQLAGPATTPWWYHMTGADWRVLFAVPGSVRLAHTIADRLREAPEAWRRRVTAEDWTAFLHHPSARIREAAITSVGPAVPPMGSPDRAARAR